MNLLNIFTWQTSVEL